MMGVYIQHGLYDSKRAENLGALYDSTSGMTSGYDWLDNGT